MKLFGWGIALIGIGVLSYIIPIFGIQFRIVELFNLITLGFGGVVVILIGLALIVINVILQRTRS